MKINEVSKMLNLSQDTIRYYEKEGLITPDKKNYFRDYSNEVIEELKAIVKLRNSDFTIGEIKTLVDFSSKIENPEHITDVDRNILKEILLMSDIKIKDLEEKKNNIDESLTTLKKISFKVKKALEEGVMKGYENC